jgi:hypothetical protein
MFCLFSNVVRLSSSVAILSGVAHGSIRKSFSSVGYDRQYCVAFANLIIPVGSYSICRLRRLEWFEIVIYVSGRPRIGYAVSFVHRPGLYIILKNHF